jgi:hypothetical protein
MSREHFFYLQTTALVFEAVQFGFERDNLTQQIWRALALRFSTYQVEGDVDSVNRTTPALFF